VKFLPVVPVRISVSLVPALNTVAVRSFVVSSEKKKTAGTPVPQSKNFTKPFLS